MPVIPSAVEGSALKAFVDTRTESGFLAAARNDDVVGFGLETLELSNVFLYTIRRDPQERSRPMMEL
jgi:hypothetical protein